VKRLLEHMVVGLAGQFWMSSHVTPAIAPRLHPLDSPDYVKLLSCSWPCSPAYMQYADISHADSYRARIRPNEPSGQPLPQTLGGSSSIGYQGA
jgi:hypothetical protein